MRVALPLVLLLVAGPAAESPARQPERPAPLARARMEHHLSEVDRLTAHFETVLDGDCPRLASAAEWRAYLDAEVERAVSLLAHLEEAWLEAKHTGDDEVRRAAKAPRQRVQRARALVDKLAGCAQDHGTELSPVALWQRIEREVPQRQAEIALPSPD